MNTERPLESFRIGQRALGIVLPRDHGTRHTGDGAVPELPNTIFNWIYQGLKRTDLVPDGKGIDELRDWIQRCDELDIKPTLVLSPVDQICTDEELTDLLMETSVDVVWAHPNNKPSHSSDMADQWTQELAVALPDEAVVDAYYSQAGDCPISAWSLQSEYSFWLAYGAAIQRFSHSYHWHECADMARYRSERPNAITIPPKLSWISGSEDDLAKHLADANLGSAEQLSSHCRVPFVFSVRRGAEWVEYGRLPGLSMSFELPLRQEQTSADAIAAWLRSLSKSFTDLLAARITMEGSTSGGSERLGLPLTVLTSNEAAVAKGMDFGELIMDTVHWTVLLPQWTDGLDPGVLQLEFLGFQEKASGRPVVRMAEHSVERLDHLEFHLERSEGQVFAEPERTLVFRLSSTASNLEVLLTARPA